MSSDTNPDTYGGIIERYREFLPVTNDTLPLTLLEGNTPLVQAPRLAERLGFPGRIYLKYEALNPTGSFKDRGMALAVTKARELGAKAVMCASTGNTAASAAAYAARAGLKAVVVIPEGAIAMGKLSQALIYGATTVTIRGNFDEALSAVRALSGESGVVLVNSVNPYRIEGQKTAAFEIVDALGDAPDYLFIPVGNAGNITAYWAGFREYARAGRAAHLPRMMGYQAEGAAPIVKGEKVAKPETIATAIRIGNPASWAGAVAASDESRGTIDSVTDSEILEAYRLLARLEGVFCEPASAASVAGLMKAQRAGLLKGGTCAVCVLTGHGLKDPDRAIETTGPAPMAIDASVKSIKQLLKTLLDG